MPVVDEPVVISPVVDEHGFVSIEWYRELIGDLWKQAQSENSDGH
jgi:hypothetical protein